MACMEKRKQKPLRKHKRITRHVQDSLGMGTFQLTIDHVLALWHVTVQNSGAVLSSVSKGMKENG